MIAIGDLITCNCKSVECESLGIAIAVTDTCVTILWLMKQENGSVKTQIQHTDVLRIDSAEPESIQ